LPFYQSAETILLDSFANEYTKNYIDIPLDSFLILPEEKWPYFMNLKSVFDKDVYTGGSTSSIYISYINKKYLLELEYFSANANDI